MTAFLVWQAGNAVNNAVLPVNMGGWVALIVSLGTFVLVLYDRIAGKGKMMANVDSKLAQLCDKIEDFEETQSVMDSHLDSLDKNVSKLTYEMRGPDGKNGIVSLVRDVRHRVEVIERRNIEIDAVERDRMRKAGRTPERLRDAMRNEEGAEDS